MKGHDWQAARLFRTSYFPGLGWMMARELWQELGPAWPLDHWVRWGTGGMLAGQSVAGWPAAAEAGRQAGRQGEAMAK